MSSFKSSCAGAFWFLSLIKNTISRPALTFSDIILMISDILRLNKFLSTALPFFFCLSSNDATKANRLYLRLFSANLAETSLPAANFDLFLKKASKSALLSLRVFLSMINNKPLSSFASPPF